MKRKRFSLVGSCGLHRDLLGSREVEMPNAEFFAGQISTTRAEKFDRRNLVLARKKGGGGQDPCPGGLGWDGVSRSLSPPDLLTAPLSLSTSPRNVVNRDSFRGCRL